MKRPDKHGKQPKLILWQHPGDDVTGMVARSEKIVNTTEEVILQLIEQIFIISYSNENKVFKLVFSDKDLFLLFTLQLLGGEVYHYHTKIVTKEPYVGGTFEWHQDYGYWYKYNCLFPDMLTVWIAIDNCQKSNGCLQVLRGSHKCGRIEHLIEAEQTCADSKRVKEIANRCELVHGELNPGDALFFHCNLLHSSGDNISENIRRAMVIAYNRASNDAGPHEKHPGYTKLYKVRKYKLILCERF
ncbi:hypothetical protein KUTeg_022065 [Tegillarca granosa]|uniref:Phytanoyl-CoA dioxygenase family protein n=1 Tax=Tegillarca granosa TaxID=220873 RepID=A0ABQ9E550_TEGGR|nr:hypothetical protein KUTeg_022065 [Tegillarca granosa]